MAVVTVAQRRAIEIERLRRAGADAITELRRYAVTHAVRFAVFGSFARGDIVSDSDFDLVIDGPEAALRPARDAVESICARLDLRPDVHLAPEVSEGLMIRVRRDAIVLP